MGSVKLEQRQKVEACVEKGRENAELAGKKIDEAEVSRAALDSVEAVDDDTSANLENAYGESETIANAIAESEIRQPGDELSKSLTEVGRETSELGDKELENANAVTEMTGDYTDVGAKTSAEFQQSGQEFKQIADDADTESDEVSAAADRNAAALEGVF